LFLFIVSTTILIPRIHSNSLNWGMPLMSVK
jgi:hypothetical protein